MVHDMQYGHEVVVKDGDKMPVYETITSSAGALNLAMMEELDYDDPLWEELLNQMSYKEQVLMMNYGMGHLAGAESIGAPGLKATDGPQGLYHTKYAFPSPVMSAASFNTALINRLGDAYAHEALHSGYSMVYAPGGNIHRTLYSGRNFEYYSEDGLLGGKMLASQVKGMTNRGIIVCSKHFAFNDQELNRYGVATFFNEQSAREVYLKVFEIGVREGGMNGLMSAFNRIGCTWTGRHQGLLTEVLRNEWNFIGIVETDACSGPAITPHMEDKWAVAEGLVAGNDVWMSRGSETMLDDSKDNPTVMLALREVCHRVLYVQLHSAAINGVTVNTKMIKVVPWWQSTLTLLIILASVALVLSLLMAVTSFILKKRNIVLSNSNIYIENNSLSLNSKKIPDKDNKKIKKRKIKTKTVNTLVGSGLLLILSLSGIISSLILFAPNPELKNYIANGELHVCNHYCPVCGKCNDQNCEDKVCSDKCKCVSLTIEAESEYCEHVDGAANWGGMRTGKDEERGITYIQGLDGNAGARLNFKFLSDKSGRALLSATIRRRPWNFDIDEFVEVYANNEKLDYEMTLPGTCENADYHSDDGTDGKGDFYSFNIRNFEVKEGLNIVSFIVTTKSGGQCPHFDKIDIISNTSINEYQHLCESKCILCGKCTNKECEDQYVCHEKCECETVTIEAESEYVERVDAAGNALSIGNNEEKNIKFIKDLNGKKDARITYKFLSADDSKALLKATFRSLPWAFELHKYVGININGKEYEYKNNLPKDPNEEHTQPSQCDFVTRDIGLIELTKGLNLITFIVNDLGNNTQCPDFDKIEIFSEKTVQEYTHNCLSKCSLCGKCTNLECKDLYVCNEKCSCKENVFEVESDRVIKVNASGEKLNVSNEGDRTYLANLNGKGGSTIKFTIYSEEEGKAILKATFRSLPWIFELHKYVGISINGEEYEYKNNLPKDPNEEHTQPSQCDFITTEIGLINLNKGVNEITFLVKEGSYPQCPDFDKIIIYGGMNINEYTHTCESKCPLCGKCTNQECEDTYVCKEKCECKVTSIEAESESVTITQAAEIKYGGVTKGNNQTTNTGYLKVENDNGGAGFTFNINSNKETEVLLYAYLTPKKYIDYELNSQFDMYINNEKKEYVSEKVMRDETLLDNHWAEYFVKVKLAEIHLIEGDNTITFTAIGWHGIMMDKIELYTDAVISEIVK